VKRAIIWRCVLVTLIMITLYTPAFCFVMLLSSGRVLDYVWPLPDPTRLWIVLFNSEAVTDQESFALSDGFLVVWPIVLVFVLVLVFNRFSRRAFYELFLWKNVRAAWRFVLAMWMLGIVFTPLGQPQGWILLLLAYIPAFGWLAGRYQKRLKLSPGPIMKLGWTMTWRYVLGTCILLVVTTVVVGLTAYLILAPGLAVTEVIQTGSEEVIDRVASHPLRIDTLFDLMGTVTGVSLGVVGLTGLIGCLLVPGRVFWTISEQPARNQN